MWYLVDFTGYSADAIVTDPRSEFKPVLWDLTECSQAKLLDSIDFTYPSILLFDVLPVADYPGIIFTNILNGWCALNNENRAKMAPG